MTTHSFGRGGVAHLYHAERGSSLKPRRNEISILDPNRMNAKSSVVSLELLDTLMLFALMSMLHILHNLSTKF
jgi:hypothetical protein